MSFFKYKLKAANTQKKSTRREQNNKSAQKKTALQYKGIQNVRSLKQKMTNAEYALPELVGLITLLLHKLD